MKIGRRSFLSLVIGGAVGTQLTPLPWKLMDDSSIWTQMWPWTPVPPDGKASYVHSACTLCPGGCGITVRKIDDRAVKIEGMDSHPVNHGGACILGLSGLQMLYGPTRVETPLKRSGPRGAGKWAPISWEAAIQEVVQKLKEIRSGGEPQAVACIADTDRGTTAELIKRFLTVYGSPNFIRTPSIQDAFETTLFLMHGRQGSLAFDVENADFLLSFGSGILEGWGSPVRMFRANSRLKDGKAKVVQVEPRLSNTAAKSDEWIPINPGTHAALALGMAHVIAKEGLYHYFVRYYAAGFEDWQDEYGTLHKGFKTMLLDQYSPSKVSEITGIPSNKIEELAREFAKSKKPLAICGRGSGSVPGTLYEAMAVHALNAMVGSINRTGGVWSMPEPDYIRWPEVQMDATAAAGMQRPRIDEAGSAKYPFSRYLLNRLPDVVNTEEGYPVKALFISGANPCYAQPGAPAMRQAFEKIPFVVSFSSFMDETAALSDLILPHHSHLERYQDVPDPAGMPQPVISLVKPVVPPLYDTMHTGDVFIRMAHAMGGTLAAAFPWRNYEKCLKETLAEHWNDLNKSVFQTNDRYRAPSWNRAFTTKSGKFEFFASEMQTLPQYQPIEPEGPKSSLPLLMIPYDSMRLSSGYIGNPPFMTKTVDDDVLKGDTVFVEINPATAQKYGLADGVEAVLETIKGKGRVRVRFSQGVGPDIVAVPRGLGHSAYDKYLAGKGVNVNDLMGPLADPVSGFDAAFGIRAKLSKV